MNQLAASTVNRRATPLPVIAFLVLAALPIRFHIGPLQMTGLRAYLLVMIPVVLPIILRDRNLTRRAIDLMFALHVFWIWVSIMQVAPQAGAQRAGSVSADFIGGYLIARAYVTSAEAFRRLITTITALVLVTLPLALGESLSGRLYLSELLNLLPGITADPIIEMPSRLGLDRAQAVFAHPIHYGLFCSTAAALFYLTSDQTRTRRLAILSLICLACFLSLSSGALLSLTIQIGLILWAWAFATVSRKWLWLAGLSCLLYLIIEMTAERGAFRVFLSYATFSAHNAYWRSMIFEWGIYNLWANPIFGVGNNGWERPSFMRSASMDNFWLYIAVKYGIPAFLLLMGGYLLGLISIICGARSQAAETARLRKAWIIGFTGLSLTLATVHVWTSVYSYVFFLFGAGLWMLDAQDRSASVQSRRIAAPPTSRNLRPIYSRCPTPQNLSRI